MRMKGEREFIGTRFSNHSDCCIVREHLLVLCGTNTECVCEREREQHLFLGMLLMERVRTNERVRECMCAYAYVRACVLVCA